MLQLAALLLSTLMGIAGAGLSKRFPASGVTALALALVPVAGVFLAQKFC